MVDQTIALQVKPLDIATPLMQAAKMRQMESEQQRTQEADNRDAVALEMRGLAPYANSPDFAGRWTQSIDSLAQAGKMRPDIAARMRDQPSVMAMHSVLAQSESAQQQFQKQQLEETKRQHGATMGLQQQQFAETQKQHGISQGNVEREFALKKEQADLAAKGTEYREIDDGEGGKVLVKINKLGDSVSRVPIGGQSEEPKSPYAPTQKLSEDQTKDRMFVSRMVTAHNTINSLEKINEGVSGFIGGTAAGRESVRDSAPFNLVASEDRQKSIQAQRNFVNAILRKESGAAISNSEFQNAQRQYFPQPGDGPKVIEQKRVNRQQAIEGMMQGTGRGYKPPAEYTGTKGPAQPAATKPGEVIDYTSYFGGAK